MFVLGIDTAQKNLGLGIIEAEGPGSEIRIDQFEKFQPKSQYMYSDFINNAICIRRIRQLIQERKPEFVCLESAALAASHGMVSIGSIHGAILQVLVDERIPFVYCTSGKHKKFLTGKGKASKMEIKVAIKEFFNWTARMNADEADAIGLALIGLTFAWILKSGGEKLSFYPLGIPAKIGNEIFFSTKVDNKKNGKPAGIMHRKNEFYWIPHEKEEQYGRRSS